MELANGSALVAGIAFDDGVRANQREAVLVFAHRLQRNHPAVHAVASLALGSHLPAMDVSMAVGALVADVGENGIDVALLAGHVLVHATQRIFGLVMIEFRDAANGLPAAEGMAVLARNIQRAMRTARGLHRGCGLCACQRSQQQQGKLNSQPRNHLRFTIPVESASLVRPMISWLPDKDFCPRLTQEFTSQP